MSSNSSKVWLIGYDIACSSRLQRVHKRIKKQAMFVQFSVYAARGRNSHIVSVLDELRDYIDDTADDVRAYHIPQACMVWTLGKGTMAEGVLLQDEEVVRLLSRPEDDKEAAGHELQQDIPQDTEFQHNDIYLEP